MLGRTSIVILCYLALAEGVNNCENTAGTAIACDGPFCQSLTDGTLTPAATVCNNELSDEDCRLLFPCNSAVTLPGGKICDPTAASPTTTPPIPANDWPFVRAVSCTRSTVRDLALQCARQCGLCCETASYDCEDDDNSPINCELNRNKCTNSNWTNIMATYCPMTCGLCSSGTCTDLNSGCNSMTALCRHVDWITYMTTNCARTCGTCSSSTATTTSSSCSNIASNCAVNANLCTNSVYRSLMLQQCCATCSGTSVVSSCTDSSTSCSNWVSNGFCSSTFYTTAQKRQYCARSCNLC